MRVSVSVCVYVCVFACVCVCSLLPLYGFGRYVGERRTCISYTSFTVAVSPPRLGNYTFRRANIIKTDAEGVYPRSGKSRLRFFFSFPGPSRKTRVRAAHNAFPARAKRTHGARLQGVLEIRAP